MNLQIFVFLAIALAHSVSSAQCVDEYERTMQLPQTPSQLRQNEELKTFDPKGDDWRRKQMLATAHFDENAHRRTRARLVSDAFPFSACLLRILADEDRTREVAPFAQEAYALRLLAGDGVPRDRQAAIKYLTRASESWHYGSASIRLGRLYLEGKPTKDDVESAVHFLKRAVKLTMETPGGSANPADASEMLFDIYLDGKYRERDVPAATSLLRSLRARKRVDEGLNKAIEKYPTLAAISKQEEQKAIDSAALEPEVRRMILELRACERRCNNPYTGAVRCSCTHLMP